MRRVLKNLADLARRMGTPRLFQILSSRPRSPTYPPRAHSSTALTECFGIVMLSAVGNPPGESAGRSSLRRDVDCSVQRVRACDLFTQLFATVLCVDLEDHKGRLRGRANCFPASQPFTLK